MAGRPVTPAVRANRISDGAGEISWRIYIFAMAISFFVVVEPAPTDLVFFIALGVFCFSRPEKTPFLSGTALTGVLLYLGFSVLSLAFVQFVPMAAVRAVIIEFYMIALFALTAYYMHTRGDKGFATVLAALTVGAILASFVTIVAVLDLIPNSHILFRGEGTRYRVKATFKDPNVFGPFLVPSLLFVVWVIVESARLRLLALGALGLILLSLLSTYSRGAWIHAFISLSVMGLALLVYRPTARSAFTGVVCFAIIVLATALLYLDQITARVSDSFLGERLSLQSYDDDRFGYVVDAARQVWEHPLGIGPAQARFVYGYLPHNTFVAFAMHNGIFASLGLILIYGASMTRCAVKIINQNPGWLKYALIFATLLGLLVLMQVVGAIHWRHLYLVCGMAFGTYTTNRLLPDRIGWAKKQRSAHQKSWQPAE